MKKMIPVSLTVVATVPLSVCAIKTVIEIATAASIVTEVPTETSADTREGTEAAEETKAEENRADMVKETVMVYSAEFPDDKHTIVVPGLFERIDAGEDMSIIDTRGPEDYIQGYLKDAVNLPYGADVVDNLGKIPDDVPVHVNCYTDQTPSQTVTLLNMAGEYATNIQSGWNNGISQTEGYETYIDAEEVALPQGIYEVGPATLGATAAHYKEITSNTISSFNFKPESLMELADAESGGYAILPVRQTGDYAKDHIVGVTNIPFAKGIQKQFSQTPIDKLVVVYCYTSQIPPQTTTTLCLLGYEAYSLQGDMGKEGGAGQLGNGYPVVTEQPVNR